MAPRISKFYPVIIQESRYSGAYSGGQWILTGGLFNPRKHLAAWGSDIDCMRFWTDRKDETPLVLSFEDDQDLKQDDVLLHVGNDPSEMVEEAREHVQEEED